MHLAPAPVPVNAPAASRRNVLLIEDDPACTKLLKYYLGRSGFAVRHASDGQQALMQFDHPELPDLVVMDLMLPYHSGEELLVELRRRPAWANVPVMMLSARSQEQDVVGCLGLGANDYLSKPFRPAELMARIEKLVSPANLEKP